MPHKKVASARIAGAVLASVVVSLLLLTVVVPRLTRSVTLSVLTGSMDPTIPPGSLVLVRPTDPATLERGDVITFEPGGAGTYVTHRIVGVTQSENGPTFTTKGDANRTEDPTPVLAEEVRGRVVFHLPMVGRLGQLLHRGRLAAGLVAALFLLSAAPTWSSRRRRHDADGGRQASVDHGWPGFSRELALVEVTGTPQQRREAAGVAAAFGATVDVPGGESMVITVVGPPSTVDALLELLDPAWVVQVRRTGAIALQPRGLPLAEQPVPADAGPSSDPDDVHHSTALDLAPPEDLEDFLRSLLDPATLDAPPADVARTGS